MNKLTDATAGLGAARRAVIAAGVAALTLALVACGGGSAETELPPEGRASALAVSQPGQLTRFMQDRLRTLSAQGRLDAGVSTGAPQGTAVALLPSASAAAPARSSTLVQEEGVDEADLIQSDGRFIYTLQPQAGQGPRLEVYERGDDGRAVARTRLTLPSDGALDVRTEGMVHNAGGSALTVISQRWTQQQASDLCTDVCPTLMPPQWLRSSVDVQRIDVSNPAAASAGARLSIDGHLVDSRRIGDSLYVVTSHRPFLAVEQLPAGATPADREAAIGTLNAAQLLPRLRRNGGASQPLLADTDCYVQTANASMDVLFTTITVIDLHSASLSQTSRCFVGGSEALYMSTTSLYLATTRWSYPTDTGLVIYPQQIKTDIHKFALAAGSVAYRGTGAVDGHLGWDREKKSYRMSEHNGDLRVLSYTGQVGWFTLADATSTSAPPPSPARLSVLRERRSDSSLQLVAALPNTARPAPIGKTSEQVYAVRFMGDRAYVVTFRRTDPLYVLDLSNPADPKTVGALEVAGFSDYLFPLPNGLLLGVGHDADSNGRTTGLKVALFDVADPALPSQRASLTLGATGSASALDGSRHGLNLLLVGGVARVALPVNLSSSAYAGWQHGLQRFEVDTSARTMRALGMVGGEAGNPYPALWLERSVQIGDHVYYLAGGGLSSHAW